jgi:hypothetical protein
MAERCLFSQHNHRHFTTGIHQGIPRFRIERSIMHPCDTIILV